MISISPQTNWKRLDESLGFHKQAECQAVWITALLGGVKSTPDVTPAERVSGPQGILGLIRRSMKIRTIVLQDSLMHVPCSFVKETGNADVIDDKHHRPCGNVQCVIENSSFDLTFSW